MSARFALIVVYLSTLAPLLVAQNTSPADAQATDSRPRRESRDEVEYPRIRTLDDLFLDVTKRVPAFGGMFIGKEKTLNVYLLDPSPQALKTAEQVITEVFGAKRIPRAGLRALKGQFGFSQLKDWHDRVRALLNMPGVILSDIDESRNRLLLGLEQVDLQPKIEEELTKLQIPRDAVLFVKTKQPELFEQQLIGGREVDHSEQSKKKECTLGFIAVQNGTPGFVTCAHCTIDGIMGGAPITSFTSPDWPGKTVGMESQNPQAFYGGAHCPSGRYCRYSDSAFITISSGITGQRGAIGYPGQFTPFRIVEGNWGSNYQPLFDEDVWKVGMKSGLTEGSINGTCVDIDVQNNKTLLCQSMVKGHSVNGDSGSPVFLRSLEDDHDVKLLGMLSGGGEYLDVGAPNPWVPITPDVEEYFWFSPLNGIGSELGLFEYTWGNSSPMIQIITPNDGAKVGYGGVNATTFQAKASDFEDGTPKVNWFSDEAFPFVYMGAGEQIQFTFSSKGMRTITAQAVDQKDAAAYAHISVTAVNSAPMVSIVTPTSGQILYRGFTYPAQGSSFDSETFSALPCNSLEWTSTIALDFLPPNGFPKFGCTTQVVFKSDGWRTLKLKGTDADGVAGNATVAVDVVDAPLNSPPVATILSPLAGTMLDSSKVTTLIGTAKDPDGKSPISFKWMLLIGSGLTTLSSGSMSNGQQTSLSWRPSDSNVPRCGSATILFSATDADGLTSPSASAGLSFLDPTCIK